MRSPLASALLLAALTGPVLAQEPQDRQRPDSRFHIGLDVAAGAFRFDTRGSNLDDRTDARMFRFDFEATSPRGFGGGLRFEATGSDDDLFSSAGFAASEAKHASFYAHFTYRLQEHRFAMPLRAGVLYDGLSLEENVTSLEVKYGTIGPYFEMEPEVVLARSGRTQWSLYGQLGFGFGGTAIRIDNDPRDYYSFTSFFGVELGTRLDFGSVVIGVSYIGRWQTMDESDPEGFPSQVALGYDAEFQGLMATFAIVF